jgi:hypothetical protein
MTVASDTKTVVDAVLLAARKKKARVAETSRAVIASCTRRRFFEEFAELDLAPKKKRTNAKMEMYTAIASTAVRLQTCTSL